jgi:hypothetical protein
MLMKAPDSVARFSRVEFELARFEVMGDCCKVQGRWFGVRGRRFMRPALTAIADDHSIRLLADLSDKPWTAEDGELWQATFPFSLERSQLQEAELTVAPDVTIPLPAPQPPAGAARKKSSPGRVDAAPRTARQRAGGGSRVGADEPLELDRARRKSRTSDPGGGREADTLRRELAELRKAYDGLRRQLDRLEADKARTAQRLDEMGRGLRRVTHEREKANAARDRIAAELGAVERERDKVVAERDAAQRERDQVALELEAAQRAHHEVLQESNAARAARDRAVSVRWVRWR